MPKPTIINTYFKPYPKPKVTFLDRLKQIFKGKK
jgi:hypothetical protein